MANENTSDKKHLRCPFCDEDIAELQYPFCDACKAEIKRCPQCGKALAKDAATCPDCGTSC